MKNTLIVLIAVFSFACSGKKEKENREKPAPEIKNELAELTDPVNETLDELGASLIYLLKHNNFEKFTEFLPVREDVEQIAMQYSGPEEKKKKLLLKMEEKVKEIMIYSKTGFDEVFNSALKANVVWNDAHFSFVEYEITKKDNIERAAMTIYFIYNNLKYKIGIGECIRSDRGWLVTDSPKWENID